MPFRLVSIKKGLPSLEEGKRRLLCEVRRCHLDGITVLKIIHGYGSCGQGGALRVGLHQVFAQYEQEGDIIKYVAGENFSIFHSASLEMITCTPELRKDPDLDRSNLGVSFLWIQ